MISLTFGEQVKIVLSRKGMTIKELAEEIEERTGKKMSRQNLTQRLGRDNFQEQDMRMIADILGCSFHLSILSSADEEKVAESGEELPTGSELEKLAVKKERKAAREEAKRSVERDITVGEFVDMLEDTEELEEAVSEEEAEADEVMEEELEEPIVSEAEDIVEIAQDDAEDLSDEEELDAEEAEEVESISEPEEELVLPVEESEGLESAEEVQQEPAEEPVADSWSEEPASEEEASKDLTEEAEPYVAAEETPQEAAPEEPVQEVEEKKESAFSKITRMVTTPKKEKKSTGWPQDFQPIKKRREDIDEDLVNGDVNPYTGHEYQTNSVRMHPHRIGYVQVYDRKDHKWTDMTEWAFLGVEERKKAALGKDYEPPIYLD